jgi:hypothetical protein
MTITLPTPSVSGGATGRSYVDLSQIASLVNRRFYRQGLNWAVAGFKVSSLQPGAVSMAKLPNTWVTSNAWEKAFRAWNKQQMEAIEDAGAESAVARFRDFKVFADPVHVTAGVAANLLPVDFGGNSYAPGEWEESIIVLPQLLPDASGTDILPQEYKLHVVGTNKNGTASRGIIEGYADSRAYPQSPDPVSPLIGSDQNWLRQMFDVGSDNVEITENATDRNDDLPYPQVDYPGGQTQAPGLEYHDFATIFESNAVNGIGIQRMKGGNFPCGLIAFDWSPVNSANLVIQIDLVPGNHRGYLCEPMTEM